MSESILPSGVQVELPLLALRNSVLFPAAVVPVNVGRARSIRLVEEAFEGPKPTIGVVAQRQPEVEDPSITDLYGVGTVARVLKVIRLSSGNYSVVLQGVARMRLIRQTASQPCLRGLVERIAAGPIRDVEVDALAVHLRESGRRLMEATGGQRMRILDNVKDPGVLADLIMSNLTVSNEKKQRVLETHDVRLRLRAVLDVVNRQLEVRRVKREISTMVKDEMSKNQREYLLRQQMKAIRKELGEDVHGDEDLEELRERVASGEMSPEAQRAARKQLRRMDAMPQASAEYHVARQYVEWLVELPWSKVTLDRLHVGEARRVLDEDHFGLTHVKKRILEYIAVRSLRSDVRGPILCFVGPPGVGKTSLARSIARAAGRNFARIALGGVQDESELRGHRRTYVGSFPGRIVAGLKRAESKNPVFLLDEVDKLTSSQRGDPASALLEILDPEQNSAFADHYLEVPFDLSQVMFIATANRKDTIAGPLLDRMEIIDVTGYTHDEKCAIAEQYLVPRQLSEHGLTLEQLEFETSAVERMIEDYTREAGVRQLDRQVAAVCRNVAVRIAHGDDRLFRIEDENVTEVLGPPRIKRSHRERAPQPGLAYGMAWTPGGGDLMPVECRTMPGAGRIHLTGNMGDVLKEAVVTAFTYLRARPGLLALPEDFLVHTDVHVHFPQGAIPKDGPAAGLAVLVSLSSLLSRLRPKPDVAMSGEITLRGRVLRVTEVKQKCLAAHRLGVHDLILPAANGADLQEVPEHIRKMLTVHLVSRVEEVLAIALETPEPLPLTA